MKAKTYIGTSIALALFLGVYQFIFAENPKLSQHLFADHISIFSEAAPENSLDTVKNESVFRFTNTAEVVPIRTGFPFCETFIGFDPRPNAIWDGTLAGGAPNPNVKLTGNSLQLTSNATDENGYVFVDIPFSSAFGLKVSFEFSSWGGDGADGFSFFMFDGSIDATTFEIGGTGGALGYTATRARFDEENLISPGLKGAYLGIGFDELGNFGNSFNGKNGGMEDPSDGPDGTNRPLFKHSVVVRGPSDGNPAIPLSDRDRENAWMSGTPGSGPRWDSYKFIDGRIFDPVQTPTISTNPPDLVDVSQYLHSEKMTLDTDAFADACLDEGFRKVFIDLNPIDVNDRSKGYTVEVQMLVNVGGVIKLINVFDGPINFDFAAPELLKVGFAASTGAQTNFHEIRNVTVQVSNEDELEKPLVGPISEEVCADETKTFDLDVELRNDVNNAFIRCIQLYYSEQEAIDVITAGGTSIPFPPSNDVNSLCPTGNCVDVLCLPERTQRTAYDSTDPTKEAGEFEVYVELIGGVEVPKVRFVPEPGYFGQTSIFYTATDNFGQISEPEEITINILPQPVPVITTLDPLVWEQQETSKIRVLLNASITDTNNNYQWFRDGTAIAGATGIFYLATQAGEYSISVTLPQGCYGESNQVVVELVGDLGPNFQQSPEPETCSGLGSIEVKINDLAISGVASDGSPGNEKWKIVTSAGELVEDWTFLAQGQSEIMYTGLEAGEYVLLIGDEYRSGQPGSDGTPLYRHEMPFTILPNQSPLQLTSVVVTPESCFGSGGQIILNASGGDGPTSYSFNLINQTTGVSIAPGSIAGGQAIFSLLPQGVYDIEVRSAALCLLTDVATITGPTSELDLALVESNGISCGISDSGSIHWRASEGTAPYSFVSLERNGVLVPSPSFTRTAGDFVFTNLIEGDYTFNVKDANECLLTSSPVSLSVQAAPEFEVVDVIICEGGVASLQPLIVELSNSEPTFSWKNHDGVAISSNTTIGGVTYSFVDDGNPATPMELLVQGLSAGVYDFTLSISGANTCNQPDQVVAITVTPLPIIANIGKLNASCFQQQDGRLEVILDPAFDPAAHSFELVGVSAPQDSNIFENLPAGTYEISVVNKISNCETVSESVEIAEPALLGVEVLDQQNPTCDSDNGFISFTITGGTPAYSVLIDSRPIDEFNYSETGGAYTVQSLGPGNYVVEIIDSKSCQALTSSPIVLSNEPLDPISVTIDDLEICAGDEATITPLVTTAGTFELTWYKDAAATQEIKTTSTPNPSGVTYTVDAAAGSLKIQGLPVGDQLVYMVVSGPNLCPRPAYPAKIKVYEPLKATLAISDETCFGAQDGNIEVIATGADGSYEYSLNGGTFTSNRLFSSLAPGTYTVEVRSQNGCGFSSSGTVAGSSEPISTNVPDQIRASCGLGNGGFENLVITGGWGGYTIKWTQGSPSGSVVAGDEKGASNLFPGDYFLSVTDQKGCTEIFQFNLGVLSDPEYTLVPTMDVCEGSQVEIRPVHLQPSPNLPPAAFTEVRWYKKPNQVDPIQNGPDPLKLGVVYTIDDSDWLNPKLLVDGLPVGVHNYYFYVECTGVELSSKVEIFPIPKVEFSALSETCFDAADGKIKIVEGAEPNLRYSVDGNPETTQAILEAQLFEPGKYSIVVTRDGVGCPTAPVEVEILKAPSPLSINDISPLDPGCGAQNGKIEGEISGGWPGYEISLLEGNTKLTTLSSEDGKFSFGDLSPGDFTVEVVDQKGCSISSSLVTLLPGPTRIDVKDLEICEGEVAEIIPELEPATPGALISWYFDANKSQPIISSPDPTSDGKIYQIDTQGVLTVSGLKSSDGTQTYYSAVSGVGVCPGFTASPKVTVKQAPILSSKVDPVACFGDLGTITLTASSGDGSYLFSLDGLNFQSSGEFEVQPGIYTAYAQSGGCVTSLSNIEVLSPDAALVVQNSQIVNPSCDNSDGQLGFTFSGGHGDTYTLNLKKEDEVFRTETIDGTNFLFDQLPAGDYELEITDDFCKVSTPLLQLTGTSTPISANDVEVCFGSVIELVPYTSQTGVSPVWSWFKDTSGTRPILNGQTEGSVTYRIASNGTLSISGLPASPNPYLYYLEISGDNICPPELLEVKASVYSIPNLKVSNPSIVCDPNQTVDLTQFIEGFNPSVFDYKIISPNGSAMTLPESEKVNLTGDYKVSSAYKGLGCWNREQSIRVIVSDAELIPEFRYEADLGGGVIVSDSDVQILEDVVFYDQSQGKILVWNWDFGDGTSSSSQNPSHEYIQTGTYIVKLTTIDEFGCVAEIQKTIQAKDDYLLMVPNAFTPSGTKNQYFVPQHRGIVKMEFYVFSAWGELLFSTQSLESQGWDGNINGKPAPPDNYVYKVVFSTKSGENIEKAGTFVLIR
ncbi:T9SS type B sorting domain-containing protein [Algoriphagus aestuariicola]|uniref:T9SS type B sorting domain-containing protein n=1 Tax=Algoriphagus aestuariicola TaxID=1852016 RepID=A0ABS3BKV6_9BACT|nr:PKD domain-containing protein [Algoriphagus aestuariicola]MBN7799931.1 T9SS type B sorting domain-containing protein [Algoriphagus aestuariicola]